MTHTINISVNPVAIEVLEKKIDRRRATGEYFGFAGAISMAYLLAFKQRQQKKDFDCRDFFLEILCEAGMIANDRCCHAQRVFVKCVWFFRRWVNKHEIAEMLHLTEPEECNLSRGLFRRFQKVFKRVLPMTTRELELVGRAHLIQGKHKVAQPFFFRACSQGEMSQQVRIRVLVGLLGCAVKFYKTSIKTRAHEAEIQCLHGLILLLLEKVRDRDAFVCAQIYEHLALIEMEIRRMPKIYPPRRRSEIPGAHKFTPNAGVPVS